MCRQIVQRHDVDDRQTEYSCFRSAQAFLESRIDAQDRAVLIEAYENVCLSVKKNLAIALKDL